MREVLQEQDRKHDAADAAEGKGGTDPGCGGGGRGRDAAAAGGGSVAGGGGDRHTSWDRAKKQQRIQTGGGEGDEQDLRSLKRNEEEVLSLTRYSKHLVNAAPVWQILVIHKVAIGILLWVRQRWFVTFAVQQYAAERVYRRVPGLRISGHFGKLSNAANLF